MSARSERMYGKSPTMKRGESGDMEIVKHEKKAPEAGAEGAMQGKDGTEALPSHVRHAHERRELKHQHMSEHHAIHHRHQIEHSHHDEGGHGGKEKLHERHARELSELHDKHHKEHKTMYKRHEKELGESETVHKKEMKKEEKGDKILNKATKGGEE